MTGIFSYVAWQPERAVMLSCPPQRRWTTAARLMRVSSWPLFRTGRAEAYLSAFVSMHAELCSDGPQERALDLASHFWPLLSHTTPCHPSPQKQIGTPAELREPTRTPVLNSRPVTRSPRKTPEGAKREEGGESADTFCGEAGPRAPRCPLKLTEPADPNGPESHAAASPWGDLGIHNSGSPYCKADNSNN